MAFEPPLSRSIELAVEVHCPAPTMRHVGDFDNFVTGICDALMAADSRSKRSAEWLQADLSRIHRDLCIAIVGGAEIVKILAAKVADENGERLTLRHELEFADTK